jgi:putative membrane protein
MEIEKTIKRNTYYQVFTKPQVYLKVLLTRTIGIGAFSLVMGLIIKFLEWDSYTIPASMHSLIGIVIGLLLVFRTNTAYDRWWDGRKMISSVSHEIDMISARLGAIETQENYTHIEEYRLSVREFLVKLRNYLSSGEDGESSVQFHLAQKKSIQKAIIALNKMDNKDPNIMGLMNSLDKMLEYSNNLERIKNTPIPLSYVFHIKMSIFIYLVTLPFGMFHDLGLWAVPMVMLIYYIIAGVEIISNEIENPFANDPNDLPTHKLFDVILKTLANKH